MRSRLVFLLDILAVLAFAAAVAIEISGGVHTSLAGLRISGRSVDRAVFAVLGILAVRLMIDRRAGFLRVEPQVWRDRWRRTLQPRADSADGAESAPAGWRQLAMATAGLCLVGAILLLPQLRAMGSVPDLGDPLLSMWRIGWVYRQLLGDPRPLFDGNIFHPEPLTLTYSDSVLLPGLTAAPFLAAGVHPVITYNLLLVSSFLLSGLATYLLVGRLTGSPRAAFVSAVIYAFYPYRFEHYSHFELQMTHWMPISLLALHRFVDTARMRHAVLAALALVAQLYSSMYYAVFFVLYGGAVFVVLAGSRRVSLRAIWIPAVTAGALALVLALPLLRPYVAAQRIKGDREVMAVRMFSATGSDYLRAHPRSALYGRRLLQEFRVERELFPGVMPVVLTAASLVPPIGATRLAYATGLLVAFDGSLGFNGLVYPYLYEWFFPIRGLRVPARFSVMVGLSLAILAGFGMRRMLGRFPGRRGQLAFAATVIALAIDLRPVLALQPVWREPPQIYTSLGSPEEIVVAELPIPGDPFAFGFNTHYMYFSLWHGADMVNGYSGFLPPSYAEMARVVGGFPSEEATALLKARGVTHLTVHCAFYGDGCPEALAALDAQRGLRRVTEASWEGVPSVAYELIR